MRYRRCLLEQDAGRRTVPGALLDNSFAGYPTIDRGSSYPPFVVDGIPEIKDFNVMPRFRRRDIARAARL